MSAKWEVLRFVHLKIYNLSPILIFLKKFFPFQRIEQTFDILLNGH